MGHPSGGNVALARVYDTRMPAHGARVLVDGIWPRGVRRVTLDLHAWERAIAPSRDLRRWYGHDLARFETFRERYLDELSHSVRADALERLRALAVEPGLVILTATAKVEISHAEVLRGVIAGETVPGLRPGDSG